MMLFICCFDVIRIIVVMYYTHTPPLHSHTFILPILPYYLYLILVYLLPLFTFPFSDGSYARLLTSRFTTYACCTGLPACLLPRYAPHLTAVSAGSHSCYAHIASAAFLAACHSRYAAFCTCTGFTLVRVAPLRATYFIASAAQRLPLRLHLLRFRRTAFTSLAARFCALHCAATYRVHCTYAPFAAPRTHRCTAPHRTHAPHTSCPFHHTTLRFTCLPHHTATTHAHYPAVGLLPTHWITFATHAFGSCLLPYVVACHTTVSLPPVGSPPLQYTRHTYHIPHCLTHTHTPHLQQFSYLFTPPFLTTYILPTVPHIHTTLHFAFTHSFPYALDSTPLYSYISLLHDTFLWITAFYGGLLASHTLRICATLFCCHRILLRTHSPRLPAFAG